ncbi:MAG: hypothetical protein R2828_19650 [Saprospiraceae bacterium]
MHLFLQTLMDEHKAAVEALDAFEEALEMRQSVVSREADKKLRDFFDFFDNHIVRRNHEEEAAPFTLQRRHLLENEELDEMLRQGLETVS